jgi:hypothetical protein
MGAKVKPPVSAQGAFAFDVFRPDAMLFRQLDSGWGGARDRHALVIVRGGGDGAHT